MSLVEMRVPTIGESITEVTLSQWLKPNGSMVALDDPICEFESDKATLEFPAEASGKLEWVAAEGDDLEIGALVAKIDTTVEGDSSSGDEKKASEPTPEIAAESKSPREEETPQRIVTHPSPAAAKILREKEIDPASVSGSGRDGRITKDDAKKAEKPATKSSPPIADNKSTSTTSGFSRKTETKKMSRMRRTIAKRLVSAKNTTAMLTTFNEVDLTEIQTIRKTHQEKFVEKHGIKLGYMSFFSKACAIALMEMPDVNARIDGEHFVYHDYADISIAISTDNGLVVPPVHNVESLSLAEIELAIKELAGKARSGSLTLEEMQGGTFTITNGGIFGSMMSTPILNEPQSAILGMHSIVQRPMVMNGQIEIRPMMYLAMSYDHRVIDGSSSVTFLVRVKHLLENPIQMLLEI
jgi:2-oxoglutarate dehydrogenase E2 component (dihydrolipoamide succinyltransferase)